MKSNNIHKQLSGLVALKNKLTVYIPATSDVNKEIDNSKYVFEAARLFSDLFGGATSTPASGYWVSEDGETVKENTTLVFAYCTTEQAEAHLADVVKYCVFLKDELKQEVVALEYNGTMYFI